jgi:hypothetical protein
MKKRKMDGMKEKRRKKRWKQASNQTVMWFYLTHIPRSPHKIRTNQ